ANIDAEIAAFRPPEAIEPLTNGGDARLHFGIRFGPTYQNSNPSEEIALLMRARRERPRGCAAEQRDELAPPHSITSSASCCSCTGTSRPRDLAVFRLITSSNLVGACTGSSVCAENFVRLIWRENRLTSATMVGLIFLFLNLVSSLFKSKRRLEAENAALRQQLTVLQRKVRGRVQFTNSDRLFFIQLYRWFPAILKAMTIIRPETLVRWHRAGFRRYWRWKSRNLGGRPRIDAGLRALIRRMSIENMLWGAPRIHGELLKLGFAVAQSTVAKYMAKIDGSPSGQSWGTFLRNHMPHIAAMDLFVVPTIGFNLLYVLVIVRLARRKLVWINVTAH